MDFKGYSKVDWIHLCKKAATDENREIKSNLFHSHQRVGEAGWQALNTITHSSMFYVRSNGVPVFTAADKNLLLTHQIRG